MTEARHGGDRRPRVSVIVLAFNEEANLPACLASLQHLDCEVLVVDSGSSDGTREIARKAGAAVFEHPFETYGAQRGRRSDVRLGQPSMMSWPSKGPAARATTEALRSHCRELRIVFAKKHRLKNRFTSAFSNGARR